jgi:hypothetical protein
MWTTIVQFKLPEPISTEAARKIFLSTAPRYQKTEGLIRKYYLLSEDGATAGGVYLWKAREDAERLYTMEWVRFVQEKYGSPPIVTYYESPVVVDNLASEILSEAP